MDSTYDIAIIGSGLGGLTSGYILAKNGFKVAILEGSSQIGGCLQTFARKGVKFETGMHYIGSMGEGQAMNRFFNYLGLFPGVGISRLDDEAFDVIHLCGEQFGFASGHENFIETLSCKFPHESRNIRRYTEEVAAIAQKTSYYSFKDTAETRVSKALEISNYESVSANDFIASHITDPLLQNVLAGSLPLYAGVKDKTPLHIHALINDSNISGAYRIMGGSDQIASSLCASIRSFGGEIFTRSKVAKINCNATHATGVTLTDGTLIASRHVISGIHPESTLNLIDSPMIRPIYSQRIRGMEQTISNFTVYLHFKEGRVPYLNRNHYIYDTDSVWGGENYTESDWPRNYLYMHLCPLRPSRWAQAAEVLAFMNYDDAARWAGTPIGRRGEEYEDFKRRKADILLARLERDFPGTMAGVESVYTSSPLTYEDYTGTIRGSMYGVLKDKTSAMSSHISHRTKIPNLMLVGQNINAHGVMGVVIGSALACSELLGHDFVFDQITRS